MTVKQVQVGREDLSVKGRSSECTGGGSDAAD